MTTIATSDSSRVISAVTPMRDLLDRALAHERYRAVLSSIFGAASLGLAALGLYGLLARAVGERRREFGVRMSLGASSADVVGLVLREGSWLVGASLACGVPVAIAAGRLVGSLLYGVTPAALHTLITVSGVLVAIAIGAMFLPAYRAARIDPMAALRMN